MAMSFLKLKTIFNINKIFNNKNFLILKKICNNKKFLVKKYFNKKF